MNYPLITEYLQSVASAEDNLDKLAHLRPVLDDHGEPYRSSGAFAVVFKMQDPSSGKCYALKCFTEEQSGRAEAYHLIAEELSAVDSPYITAVQYYDKELFVDSSCADESEFPVLLMDWVEGITMEQYIRENHQDSVKMQWLCYRFCRMAAWLRSQALAHGDIKPDNVIVRPDGSLTLVDYDGMFVPAMKGQHSPTLGTRDFSHPERTVEDFDETIDDFALATTALSLKAIALDAAFYTHCGGTDRLLFSADDYRDLSQSQIWAKLQQLMYDKEFATLASQFLAALSQKTLQHLSFRLFNLSKPKAEELDYIIINEPTPNSNFHIQFKDGNCLYFKYDKEDPSKVWVVAPDKNWYGSPIWQNYLKIKGKINIPQMTENHQVIGIDYRAFSDCDCLVSISIPDSVILIRDHAFDDCSGLQSISIPDSVIEIGHSAFSHCSSLQSIVIPNSVKKIGYSAFCECSGLRIFVIPDSVAKIELMTFLDCSSLQSIVIPDSVLEIGDSAFSHCSSLQSIVVASNNLKYDSRNNCNAIIETASNKLIVGCQNTIIPDSVTEVGGWAFRGCNNLQSIAFPDSVTKIDNWSFANCINMQSLFIPNSVIKIEEEAFLHCRSLQSIIVDKNNPKYDSRNNCNAIIETSYNRLVLGCQNSVIPDTITEIGTTSFRGCSSLQSIVIPNSISKIEGLAFLGCSSLLSISVDNNNLNYDSRNNCNAIIETISNKLIIGCQNTVIPNTVSTIDNYAFLGCSRLNSIFIPDSVKKIGKQTFSECHNLRTIIVDNNNPTYDSRNNCNAIIKTSCNSLVVGCQSSIIPDTVTEIGELAFCGCSSLLSIVIPSSVKEIGQFSFSDCNSLASIIIPNSVTKLGRFSFQGCSNLLSVIIPDSVTNIETATFSECSSLQTINIPDSVWEIGNGAFSSCRKLQSIKIKNPELLRYKGIDLEKVKIITD